MTQYTGKNILTDFHFEKELNIFPEDIQKRMHALFFELGEYGFLSYPDGKKIDKELFEARINEDGAWRCIYCYPNYVDILFLVAFRKKTAKTPKEEILKAQRRLNNFRI